MHVYEANSFFIWCTNIACIYTRRLCYFFCFRNAISAFEQYFISGEEFLEHIVLRMRKQYEIISKQKSKYLKYLSADGSRLQAVKEVGITGI